MKLGKNLYSFERRLRKYRAMERKYWTCKRSGLVAAQCPSRLNVVGKWQDETANGNFENTGDHTRMLEWESHYDALARAG